MEVLNTYRKFFTHMVFDSFIIVTRIYLNYGLNFMSEPSKLIELLPSIHAGVLAIISAVIIAWYVYALPKILIKKENITKLITSSTKYIQPIVRGGDDNPLIKNRSGEIDTTVLYEHLADISINIKALTKSDNTNHLEQYLATIVNIISQSISMKPFYGKKNYQLDSPIPNDTHIPELINLKKCESITSRILRDIGSNLNNIELIQKKITAENLLQADLKYNEFMKQQEGVIDEMIIKNLSKGSENDKKEYKKRELEILKPRAEAIKKCSIMAKQNHYETIHAYIKNLQEYMRILEEIINKREEYELEKKKNKIHESFSSAIYFIMYILLTGVTIPLFLLGPVAEIIQWDSIYIRFISYILLAITVFPYFLINSMALYSIRKL